MLPVTYSQIGFQNCPNNLVSQVSQENLNFILINGVGALCGQIVFLHKSLLNIVCATPVRCYFIDLITKITALSVVERKGALKQNYECFYYQLGLDTISILYHIVIWDEISLQILDIVISRYGVFVVFTWLKRLHYSKVMWFFWTYQTVLIVLILTLYTLHYWWLFVKKCHWVNILWNNQ